MPDWNRDPAVRLDHKQPVESDRAADEATRRHAHAAHFRAASFGPRHALLPFELLGAAVQRLLQERAGACARVPFLTGPTGALPSGQLMRRIATWSSASLRAALAMIGSMIDDSLHPPGELCAPRGGVFVSTVTPRQRMAGG